MKFKFILNHLHNKRLMSTLSLAILTAAFVAGNANVEAQKEKARQCEVHQTLVASAVLESRQEVIEAVTEACELVIKEYEELDEDESSTSEETVMYVSTENYTNLNVRELPTTNSGIIGKLENGSEVTIINNSDEEASSFVKIEYKDGEGYIHSDFISEIKPQPVALACSVEEATSESLSQVDNPNTVENNTTEYNQDSDDLVLNSYLGRIDGPSGEETYYNMSMNKVVETMHNMGVEGEYWVREDGVKMLGDYVIAAANLEVHPRGSTVETSLGLALVCDTGDFADDNPTQLDIAVTW